MTNVEMYSPKEDRVGMSGTSQIRIKIPFNFMDP